MGWLPASVIVRTKPGVAPLSVSQPVQEALLAGDTQLAGDQGAHHGVPEPYLDGPAELQFALAGSVRGDSLCCWRRWASTV